MLENFKLSDFFIAKIRNQKIKTSIQEKQKPKMGKVEVELDGLPGWRVVAASFITLFIQVIVLWVPSNLQITLSFGPCDHPGPGDS